MVSTHATVTEVTDEIAQLVADAISKHFRADPDYAPQVMDAGWDGGPGRVIVWQYSVPDWAYLVGHGGTSEYDYSTEYEPMPLPEGVWAEPVNPMTLRIMPNYR
ncbi:hypothetical protein [Nonomuraea sp. NPDC049504]|uniref:hypothetical protein n=1 Tax=Nonomuraea sp. NPDC049504 TaxID=3154729 RepID=UPI00342D5600